MTGGPARGLPPDHDRIPPQLLEAVKKLTFLLRRDHCGSEEQAAGFLGGRLRHRSALSPSQLRWKISAPAASSEVTVIERSPPMRTLAVTMNKSSRAQLALRVVG